MGRNLSAIVLSGSLDAAVNHNQIRNPNLDVRYISQYPNRLNERAKIAVIRATVPQKPGQPPSLTRKLVLRLRVALKGSSPAAPNLERCRQAVSTRANSEMRINIGYEYFRTHFPV